MGSIFLHYKTVHDSYKKQFWEISKITIFAFERKDHSELVTREELDATGVVKH